MDTLLLGLFEICGAIFGIYIINAYLSTLPHEKKNSYYTKLIWLIYFLFQLWICVNDAGYPKTNVVINTILFLILIKSIYRISIIQAIYHCIFFYSLLIMIEVCTFYFLNHYRIWDAEYGFLLGSIISKIICSLATQLIKKYRKHKSVYDLPLKLWLRLTSIPISTMLLTSYIFTLSIPGKNTASFILSSIIIYIINYISFDVYDRLSLQMEMEKSNIAYAQQLELCNRQMEEREAAYQETRAIRHDLKEYLLDLRLTLKSGNLSDVENKINYILEKNSIYRNEISKSGNLVIDSLLNYKYTLASSHNILINCTLFIPEILPYDSADLCIILGNLMDNAIEASMKLPQQKRLITISISQIKGSLTIKIQNNYNSMENKLKKNKLNLFSTTKKDSLNHGLGLLSVQKTVQKYKGNLSIYPEKDVFEVSILLYPPV